MSWRHFHSHSSRSSVCASYFFTVPGQRTLPKMKTEKKVIKADHAFEFSMSCDHHMNDSLVLIFFWAVLLSILRDTTIGDNVVWFASRVDLTFNVNLWQCCAIILIWKYRRVGTAHLFVGILWFIQAPVRESIMNTKLYIQFFWMTNLHFHIIVLLFSTQMNKFRLLFMKYSFSDFDPSQRRSWTRRSLENSANFNIRERW